MLLLLTNCIIKLNKIMFIQMKIIILIIAI